METNTLTNMRAPDIELHNNNKVDIYPCFVDAKIDGEFNLFQDYVFLNKNGLSRRKFPAANYAADISEGLDSLVKEGVTLLCELHWNDGYAGDLYEFLSHKHDDAINCTIFDFALSDGSKMNEELMERRELLVKAYQKVFQKYPEIAQSVRIVPSLFCSDKEEVEDAFEYFTKQGYEGVVIKPSKFTFIQKAGWKWKAKDTADLKVLSVDPFRDRIGIEHPNNPGKEMCGVKVSNDKKLELKPGDIVEVQYLQKLFNKDGIMTSLRNPVFIRKRDDKKEVSL